HAGVAGDQRPVRRRDGQLDQRRGGGARVHLRRCPVIPAAFDYVAPSTVEDAVRALAEAGEDAKVLAGGQSLLPVLRMRLAAPTTLVDLGKVAELRGIREDGD